ncbi:hypothetical protein [uncultured Sphingomonas sp.]|uniref:hypothetical protein n=1 Tax=uncultured Sphingomonas sp. TaxID=158754 RepID=UPI0035C95DCA
MKAMTPAAPPKPAPASAADLAAAVRRRARVVPPPTEQGRRAIAGGKAKAKKQIIKMSAANVQKTYEQAGLSPATSASAADIPATPSNDFGAAAFRRIANLRPSLEGFVADERAPDDVNDDTRTVVERRVALGASVRQAIVDPDADGYIGHDFGTSATKAVVRWPFDRALGALAVPVPLAWCGGGVPHLWPTVVWFDPSATTFSLLPRDGLRPLAGFKAALIEGRGHRMCCGSPVTMAEAATAFLAMHLAYVLGTVAETHPSARISAVNFGVPVAARADEKVFAVFADVVAAATRLVDCAPTLSLEAVRIARTLCDPPALPFDLHTELAGAIAGYCSGPRYHRGAHMIVDCGSATLDIASFQLGDSRWPIGIYAAGVEPLGADACAVYRRAGASDDDCAAAAHYYEHRVYADTLGSARASFQQEEDRRYPYQVILIGGGIDGSIHGPLFERMAGAFQRPFLRPELDRAVRCEDGAQPGRLVLADGLANAPFDLRDVAMPRDRPPVTIHFGADQNSKDVC